MGVSDAPNLGPAAVEVEALVAEAAALYASNNLAGEWAAEADAVGRMLKEVTEALRGQYTVKKVIGLGGAGLIALVQDDRLSAALETDVLAVLKMPRPVVNQIDRLNKILFGETKKLIPLKHPHLIRILTADETDGGTRFFIMERLADPKDADEYLAANASMATALKIIRGAISGLRHLHERGIAHLDVKPPNIFVSSDETVVLADLGFAKSVIDSGMTTEVGGTAGYQHPAYVRLILDVARDSEVDASDTNRVLRTSAVMNTDLQLSWDLYSLGITVLVLLKTVELAAPRETATYLFRYLKLMAYRMLGGEHHHAEIGSVELDRRLFGGKGKPLVAQSYLGLGAAAYAKLAYESIEQVDHDLDKLDGTADLLQIVPELAEYQESVIQASSLGFVPFTPRIQRLIATRTLSRLRSVDQLGLVRLIYPTASHSRLEHSLGVLGTSLRFARSLYSDPLSPLFRQIMSSQDIELIMLSAILHDVGHYPLAHDLEEVDSTVFSHERRTLAILDTPAGNKDTNEVLRLLQSEEWKVDVESLKRVLGRDNARDLSLQEQIARSIISGPIDADKLDYLIRDSENLRLPYGQGIDVPKLLHSLTIAVTSSTNTPIARLGIHDKGRIPAESVLFARYSMFGSVYWHRAHRTIKAMLGRLALEVLSSLPKSSGADSLTRFRTELYAFLDAQAQKASVLPLEEWLSSGSVDAAPLLDWPTQELVWWLARRLEGKKEYLDLAEMIVTRRLYARALVVTRARQGSGGESGTAGDWDNVDAVFGKTGRNWGRRYKLTVDLQQRINDLIQSWDGQSVVPLTRFTPGDLVQRFDMMTTVGAPLVLVDFPPTKMGSDETLSYLREGEWSAEAPGELSVDNIEHSSVWRTLQNAYPTSLGKLRVYVHPDYATLVQAAVPRDTLEGLLWDVLRDASNA